MSKGSWIKLENGWGVLYRGAVRVQGETQIEVRELWGKWVDKKNEEAANKRAKRAASVLKADAFGAGAAGKRDCWVRAIANTTGMSYDVAKVECEKYGYGHKNGEGMPTRGAVKMAKEFKGLTFLPTKWMKGKSREYFYGDPKLPNMTVTKALEICKKQGKWIIGVDSHVFSVVNGKVFDNGSTRLTQRVDMIIGVD